MKFNGLILIFLFVYTIHYIRVFKYRLIVLILWMSSWHDDIQVLLLERSTQFQLYTNIIIALI